MELKDLRATDVNNSDSEWLIPMTPIEDGEDDDFVDLDYDQPTPYIPTTINIFMHCSFW
jgi:hypothetical protein